MPRDVASEEDPSVWIAELEQLKQEDSAKGLVEARGHASEKGVREKAALAPGELWSRGPLPGSRRASPF